MFILFVLVEMRKFPFITSGVNILYMKQFAAFKKDPDDEEELCRVKLMLPVSFSDCIWIGERVQVSEQVEPR